MAGTSFPEEITLEVAPAALVAARAALRDAVGPLDLSPLLRFDSSAVAVLVALRRDSGPGLAFRGVPANLRKLASLYGVEAALFGSGA